MNASAFTEPSVGAYVAYYVGFLIRYLVIAGGIYWISYKVMRQRWLAHRIQATFPPLGQIGYEVRWSVVNAACSGLSTLLIYQLVRVGATSMYFTIADYGWVYCALSALLFVVGQDTWTYWQHRLMHTPWLFRHVHAVHHRMTNPTPFGGFAQHPVETFCGNLYFILFVVFVPIHPLAIGVVGGYLFVLSVVAHCGYEFYPRGFSRHWLLGFLNTPTHHNMHHSLVGCHYSISFNYWDRLMGTIHPEYHDTFDAIKARVALRAHAGVTPRSARAAEAFPEDQIPQRQSA